MLYVKRYYYNRAHLGFMLSSSFVVVRFTLRPITHFELIFVRSARSVSRLVLLQVAYIQNLVLHLCEDQMTL